MPKPKPEKIIVAKKPKKPAVSKTPEKIKKITAGIIFSWIFIALFYVLGVIIIIQGFKLYGILILILNTFLIPQFSIVTKKLHFRFTGGVKFLFVIIIIVLIYLWLRTTEFIYALI